MLFIKKNHHTFIKKNFLGDRNGSLVKVSSDCYAADDIAIGLVANCLVKTTTVESFLFHSPYDFPVPGSHDKINLKEQVLCFLLFCFTVLE